MILALFSFRGRSDSGRNREKKIIRSDMGNNTDARVSGHCVKYLRALEVS